MPDGPDDLERRTLHERIGGRWAISWQAYLLTAGLGLLALLAGERQAFTSPVVLTQWLVLFALAMGSVGAMVLLANVTAFRQRRERPVALWIVVLFNGVCGIGYSLVLGVGAQRLGLLSDISITERAAVNALVGAWWGPTLSYFLDYRQQFNTVRRTVLADAVTVEMAQAQQQQITRLMRAELLAEVNDELVPARTAVDAMLRTLNADSHEAPSRPLINAKVAADLLRGTATDSVRPLSRRIWRQAEQRHARQRWWTLPANIARRQPFRPLAFAVVDVLGTLTQQASAFGLRDAIILVASGLSLTVAIMLVGNAFMRRYVNHHTAIFLSTFVALQSTVVLRSRLREDFLPGSAPLSWQITQVVATVLVVLITSGFGAWRDKDREVLANLREDLEHEQVAALARSRQMADVARELSQVLHGSVQSRLLACAMALDSDVEGPDHPALTAALAQALDVLTDPLLPRQRVDSLRDEVSRKVALWEGFCAFDVSIWPAAANIGGGDVAGRIVEEAITNALRHGLATRITIEVGTSPEGALRIVVIDNGTGLNPQSPSSSPGIGSAYLQQVTAGRWSLTQTVEGTRLEAIVTPA